MKANNFINYLSKTVALIMMLLLISCGGGSGGSGSGSGSGVSIPEPEGAINSYSLYLPSGKLQAGVITGNNIEVTIPYFTGITSLVAAFEYTGLSVSVNGVTQISESTPNDFTNPVEYSLTKTDGSIINYMVTVKFSSLPTWSKLSDNPYSNESSLVNQVRVAVDSSGNSYLLGSTDESNPPLFSPTLNGDRNYFLAKYDANGTLLWGKQIGATGGATDGNDIKVDSSGNVYIIGITTVAILGQTKIGLFDVYVAKYDTNGNLLWAHEFGSPSAYAIGYRVALDASDNVYVTGWTSGGIYGQTQSNVGGQDYFIVKYDNNGNLLFAKQFGVGLSVNTPGFGISVDSSSGSIYVVGSTSGAFPGQTQTGLEDYFIAKHDANGNMLWAKQAGNVGKYQRGLQVAIDSNGNAYFISNSFGSLFTPPYLILKTGSTVLVKYDKNGNIIWNKEVTSTVPSLINNFVLDSSDNPYIVGSTEVGINDQTQIGILDYFIIKYDSNGNVLKTKQVGYNGAYTRAYGIDIDSNGHVYISGRVSLTNNNSFNYFIDKY